MHNVLRDLQESPIGAKANQLEAMTIELVAMLFDFIFETKDLPDSMKVLIGRLQIPVLKAAMLDGAFFSKKAHPSRLFVNALARAGLGWSPTMGTDDPLYKKIEVLVHRVLDEFADDIYLFDELRKDLETFLASEEKNAEANIQTSADEIDQRDRQEIARVVSRAEIEKRLEAHTVPNFLGAFLRDKWIGDAGADAAAGRRGKRSVGLRAGHARRPGVERAAEAHDRRAPASSWRCCRTCSSACTAACRTSAGKPTSASSSCPTWSRRTPPR